VPLLGPSGHGGVGALQAPGTDRASWGPQREPAQVRTARKLPSSRRSIVEPGKITLKGALRASQAMAHAPPLTVILPGSIGAYREDSHETVAVIVRFL